MILNTSAVLAIIGRSITLLLNVNKIKFRGINTFSLEINTRFTNLRCELIRNSRKNAIHKKILTPKLTCDSNTLYCIPTVNRVFSYIVYKLSTSHKQKVIFYDTMVIVIISVMMSPL